MARIKGSTTKAGKTRTQRTSKDVNERIAKPHSGKTPKHVGPETQLESDQLRGIPGQGKVKAVGPNEIRTSGSVGNPGSVKVAGAGNFEDRMAADGGFLKSPAARQSGAVKIVGPVSRDYAKLVERTQPAMQTMQARFAPKRGQRLDKGVPLLKGGVGRAHAWSVYAGQPGTQRTGSGNARRAFSTDSLLINGRRRVFGPEAFDSRRDLVEPDSVVLPGGTRIF